jgi:SOS regulatory protein LexA
MTEALDRLCKAIDQRLLTPFVGAGFSTATTNNAAHAGWRGLLLDGIEVCERMVAPLPQGWASRLSDQLENADAYDYVAVAENIASRLRAVRNSIDFDWWLETTIGRLTPTPEGKRLIGAVCDLARKIIVTTNYDTLIESLGSGWTSKTWTDEDFTTVIGGLNENGVVVHMHGVWNEPESIILGSADYQRVKSEELAQTVQQALFLGHRFIFIGCGDGLRDPNIAPLIQFMNRNMLKTKTEHYLLVIGDQLRQYNERQLSPLISPVAYGGDFGELAPFLEKLAKHEDMKVSQDPRYYEKRAAAQPGPSLFELARLAQKKLDGALDALHGAERAMQQVEYRDAMSPVMNGLDIEDQQAAHEELAELLAGPVEHVRSCAEEVVAAFQRAEADVWRLTAPRYARHAVRLARITDRVVGLADASAQLLIRVGQARDELCDRQDISRNYLRPYEGMDRASRSIDRARKIAVSLSDGLRWGPPQQVPAPGGSQVAPPVVASPNPSTAEAEQSQTVEPDRQPASDWSLLDPDETAAADFQLVPLLGDIAAGTPILADENITDYLALPAQLVRGREVFLLRVRGESMTGEDGVLDGDYVIVHHTRDCQNGDMVVAFVPDEAGATVKRIWRGGEGEDKYVLLQASNPVWGSKKYMRQDHQLVDVQGKVIGVIRRDVKQGTYRPESPG